MTIHYQPLYIVSMHRAHVCTSLVPRLLPCRPLSAGEEPGNEARYTRPKLYHIKRIPKYCEVWGNPLFLSWHRAIAVDSITFVVGAAAS